MDCLDNNTIYEDSLEDFFPKQNNKSVLKCVLITICIFMLGLLLLSYVLPWSITLKGHFHIKNENEVYYALLYLPAIGTGEIKQDMVTNLYSENYPESIYGYLRGNVVSFIDNTETDKNNMYIVKIRIGKELKTNYGYTLSSHIQLQGEGEIIIKEQRLIEAILEPISKLKNTK